MVLCGVIVGRLLIFCLVPFIGVTVGITKNADNPGWHIYCCRTGCGCAVQSAMQPPWDRINELFAGEHSKKRGTDDDKRRRSNGHSGRGEKRVVAAKEVGVGAKR